ncbi:hypothetical protein [Streptomyces ficellus]|uniref:Uncharacterized protein n=1 Tax=Streptomyces ficellus TaxID=1977088 RepID=A0A6I6FPG0_9ACTN|nr:hypothetical protein [Streptomyces ficellus]QGV79528.1 hypothetical protein EIZ62_15710 [Streptomyces ficellus]
MDLLLDGYELPTSYNQALDTLKAQAPELVSSLAELLTRDDRTSAIKLLRERTEMDLAGGYHLVEALVRELGAA